MVLLTELPLKCGTGSCLLGHAYEMPCIPQRERELQIKVICPGTGLDKCPLCAVGIN
jgi:hypothetical protein